MSTTNERVVARLLADPDPRMKVASEHPELRKRIRIFLDGEDVTGRCHGFSIPGQRVELFVRDDNGRLLLDWTCGCGITRGTKRPAGWTDPRRGDGTCSVCGEEYSAEVATEVRIGILAIVPTPDPMPVPLVGRIAEAIADRWFRFRLSSIAMRGRLLRLARRAL